MTVRDLHERAVSLRVLREHRRWEAETLAKSERLLEGKNATLQKMISNGHSFRYLLTEFSAVAMDVAMLRDRVFLLDKLIAELQAKVGGDGS